MNKAIIVGNLTRDIEMKYTGGGTAIGSSGIATTRKWKDKQGQQQEEVCFIDITFFGRGAEVAKQYLHKGSKLLIEGRIKLDSWDDKNTGVKRSKHSIVVENMEMLGNKEKPQASTPRVVQTVPKQYKPEESDEIPF